MRRILFFTTGTALISLLAGCGNVMAPNKVEAPASSSQIQSLASMDATQNLGFNSANFRCSGLYTVRPQNPVFANGTDVFEVCPSTQPNNRTDIEIHGQTISTSTICAFPAKESATGNISYIASSSKTPIYQCESPSTDSKGNTGVYFSFVDTPENTSGFNAVYIVEATEMSRMKYCLYVNFNDDENCSNQVLSYSYGRF